MKSNSLFVNFETRPNPLFAAIPKTITPQRNANVSSKNIETSSFLILGFIIEDVKSTKKEEEGMYLIFYVVLEESHNRSHVSSFISYLKLVRTRLFGYLLILITILLVQYVFRSFSKSRISILTVVSNQSIILFHKNLL